VALNMTPECIWTLGAELGEGPAWSAASHSLWFVDIKGRKVHRHRPGANGGQSWEMPDQPGFALPSSGGQLLVGMPGGLHRFDPRTGQLELLLSLEHDRPRNRLNDGCVDSAGRLWFGSMDDGEVHPTGALYSWHGGALSRHDDGIRITNGPAVSPDGRTLYHTDTLWRQVHAFDLAFDGFPRRKRVLLAFDAEHGWPDGSSIDSEGCLWIAFFGGSCVRRYSPDGRLLGTVRLPCANVTKLAFGGADLRTAYVTTARKGLTAAELAAQPLAGGLFAFNSPVAGLAPTEFEFGDGSHASPAPLATDGFAQQSARSV
jgi:xylono-1,5-lactonase